MKRMVVVLMLAVMAGFFVYGQDAPVNPAQAGEDIRQALFDAQIALMSGDIDKALEAVDGARVEYETGLAGTLAPADKAYIEGHFRSLEMAARAGNAGVFAISRGQLWATILGASAQVVFDSVAAGDGATAELWLPLRDFRVSTRFSRPGADGTLAVRALVEGKMDAEAALDAVRADLLDTYQSQFAASLADADMAHTRGFKLRRAEEVGLAAGYFYILSGAYAEQRGEAALTAVDKAFERLIVGANLGVDESVFVADREALDSLIAGFRAAPLSEAELARRAGQMMRFVALVPVEYARGVRNGQVVNDIEIQEAVTFHGGAKAAFTDLRTALEAISVEDATRMAGLVDTLIAQVRAVAEPADVQATADEITALAQAVMPAEWLAGGANSDFDVIGAVLDQVKTAAAQGDYAAAESARLEAYALLELGVEQRLAGFAPDLAVDIESLFWQGTPEQAGLATLLAECASLPAVNAGIGRLQAALADAQLVLSAGNAAPAAVIGNAAVIVFREGLEAVLILASLLASLRTAEEKRYRRPLIGGAALAFAATIATWIAAQGLLNVLLPLGERLEAIVSLIAIAVLLLITNWFFHKVYWTGWMANFHARKRTLVAGVVTVSISQTVGLVLLGFTSIYREGFETVLFLQSLVLEAGAGIVLQGVLLGLAGTAIVGMITFTLQVRLPYRQMLVVTGIMIGGVLLIMVGHTVHVMQAVGWMPITPVSGLFIPFWMGQWFGLFATWQGLGFQLAAAAFVIGSYYLAEYQQKRARTQRSSRKNAEAAS